MQANILLKSLKDSLSYGNKLKDIKTYLSPCESGSVKNVKDYDKYSKFCYSVLRIVAENTKCNFISSDKFAIQIVLYCSKIYRSIIKNVSEAEVNDFSKILSYIIFESFKYQNVETVSNNFVLIQLFHSSYLGKGIEEFGLDNWKKICKMIFQTAFHALLCLKHDSETNTIDKLDIKFLEILVPLVQIFNIDELDKIYSQLLAQFISSLSKKIDTKEIVDQNYFIKRSINISNYIANTNIDIGDKFCYIFALFTNGLSQFLISKIPNRNSIKIISITIQLFIKANFLKFSLNNVFISAFELLSQYCSVINNIDTIYQVIIDILSYINTFYLSSPESEYKSFIFSLLRIYIISFNTNYKFIAASLNDSFNSALLLIIYKTEVNIFSQYLNLNNFSIFIKLSTDLLNFFDSYKIYDKKIKYALKICNIILFFKKDFNYCLCMIDEIPSICDLHINSNIQRNMIHAKYQYYKSLILYIYLLSNVTSCSYDKNEWYKDMIQTNEDVQNKSRKFKNHLVKSASFLLLMYNELNDTVKIEIQIITLNIIFQLLLIGELDKAFSLFISFFSLIIRINKIDEKLKILLVKVIIILTINIHGINFNKLLDQLSFFKHTDDGILNWYIDLLNFYCTFTNKMDDDFCIENISKLYVTMSKESQYEFRIQQIYWLLIIFQLSRYQFKIYEHLIIKLNYPILNNLQCLTVICKIIDSLFSLNIESFYDPSISTECQFKSINNFQMLFLNIYCLFHCCRHLVSMGISREAYSYIALLAKQSHAFSLPTYSHKALLLLLENIENEDESKLEDIKSLFQSYILQTHEKLQIGEGDFNECLIFYDLINQFFLPIKFKFIRDSPIYSIFDISSKNIFYLLSKFSDISEENLTNEISSSILFTCKYPITENSSLYKYNALIKVTQASKFDHICASSIYCCDQIFIFYSKLNNNHFNNKIREKYNNTSLELLQRMTSLKISNKTKIISDSPKIQEFSDLLFLTEDICSYRKLLRTAAYYYIDRNYKLASSLLHLSMSITYQHHFSLIFIKNLFEFLRGTTIADKYLYILKNVAPSFSPLFHILDAVSIVHEDYLSYIPIDWVTITMNYFPISFSNADTESIVISIISGSINPIILTKKISCDISIEKLRKHFDILMQENENSFKVKYSDIREKRIALDTKFKEFIEFLDKSWFDPFKIFLSGKVLDEEIITAASKFHKIYAKKFPKSKIDPYIFECIMSHFYELDETVLYEILLSLNIVNINSTICSWIYKNISKYIFFDEEYIIKNGPIVLICDEFLNDYPFEVFSSFNCQEIYRMPSFLSIIALISRHPELRDDGHFKANSESCFYILNPQQNLGRTQEYFEDRFKSICCWSGVIGYPPDEELCLRELEEKELFIYCGHGNGKEYLKNDFIKKMNAQSVVFLMGCHSAKMHSYSKLDPIGSVLFYLMAGCTSIVANLWSVTDKDIDRFLDHVLYNCFVNNNSLARSVTSSREKCVLRYLNGAAPIIYGLPLFFTKFNYTKPIS